MTTPGTRWFSLRRRLLLWLLGGITIGWLGAVGYAYVEARHEMDELIEAFEEHEDDPDEQRRHLRHDLLEHFVGVLFTPLLFGLPLLGGWIWFATRRGMAPLDEIAAEVAQREPQRLDPLAPTRAPQELRPLVDALNALFGRVATTLERERGFTADAAHELRTPLAALVTQAEVAGRARDDAERTHALVQIASGSRRAARLVDQLLTLARLEPAGGLVMAAVRLDSLAADVCADHGMAALDRQIDLSLDCAGEITVMGNPDMLRVLLRNLLDNAIRYTPAGGKVGVGVTASGHDALLTVSDSGPGIPAEQREQALRRFHRLAGQETAGSGLGLSIVARIAELHGTVLELDGAPAGTGLVVRLRLPVRTTAPTP